MKDNHLDLGSSNLTDAKRSQQQESGDVTKKPKLTDDFVDGIAAVVLIALVVSGASYWLYNMP